MRVFWLIGVTFLLFTGSTTAQTSLQPEQRKLVVVGEGLVLAQPDMATITVGVSRFAKTAAVALQSNSQDMAEVFAVLAAAGVADRDMQTLGLSLHPRRTRRAKDGREPKVIGFEAVNTLHIRVRVLDDLGSLLDKLTQAGANQIQSISFAMQEPRPLLDQARQRAVQDARSKAELYAVAAGVTLGQVLRIEESSNGHGQPQFARGMAMMVSEAVPIARGETGIAAQVRVEFALE